MTTLNINNINAEWVLWLSSGHKGWKHTNKHTDPRLLVPGRGCRCCRIIKVLSVGL